RPAGSSRRSSSAPPPSRWPWAAVPVHPRFCPPRCRPLIRLLDGQRENAIASRRTAARSETKRDSRYHDDGPKLGRTLLESGPSQPLRSPSTSTRASLGGPIQSGEKLSPDG